MGIEYIISIAAGGIFAFLVLIALGSAMYSKNQQRQLEKELYEMYISPNLARMDYDFGSYDDDTARIVSVSRTEGQLTIEDVLFDAALTPTDEGMEEITGNYKPD